MKTILTSFFAGALLYLPLITKAQENLAGGISTYPPVVEPPTAYRDILRVKSQGFLRQEYIANIGTWRNVEQNISSKDVFGGFDELSVSTWDTINGIWETVYKTAYTTSYNSNNLPVERIVSTTYNGNTFTSKTDYDYFTNQKVKQADMSFKNGSTFVLSAKVYFLFDANGTRYRDSVALFNPNRSVITNYTYDNNGSCTHALERNVPVYFGTDTVTENKYEYYSNGKLKRLTFYYGSASLPWVEREVTEYTYTQNGEIDKIYVWYRDTQNSNLVLSRIYGQYYTNNKLSSMVSHFFGSMQQDVYYDSIVLNYLPNGQYDTAKVYRADASLSAWESTNSHRFIFTPNSTTGINKPAATVGALKAYPNPATETLFVEIDPTITDVVDVTFTDMTGKVLKTQQLSVFAGTAASTQLPLTGIANGIYTLRVGNSALKVVKQ